MTFHLHLHARRSNEPMSFSVLNKLRGKQVNKKGTDHDVLRKKISVFAGSTGNPALTTHIQQSYFLTKQLVYD